MSSSSRHDCPACPYWRMSDPPSGVTRGRRTGVVGESRGCCRVGLQGESDMVELAGLSIHRGNAGGLKVEVSQSPLFKVWGNVRTVKGLQGGLLWDCKEDCYGIARRIAMGELQQRWGNSGGSMIRQSCLCLHSNGIHMPVISNSQDTRITSYKPCGGCFI